MTTPIVRFAPSPTGRIHVGNVRTALINWLFARREGGQFLLRIDDTDLERSTKAFEDGIRTDLTWLGMSWDGGFSQSARFADYETACEELRRKGLLYPAYESEEELERKRKIALSRGRPPVYDRASLKLTAQERANFEAEGRKPHWRFRLSGERVEWNDLVRGPQSIDTGSLSDPILIREDGSFLYTGPSVIDDIFARITHIVRGEDHVTNSAAQIEIFRALGGSVPEMAHTPLLIGADGQGLSKRLGSLSVAQMRADGFEPMAILSLLARLGTSDPITPTSDIETLIASFAFGKIGRAPARFDEEELRGLNAAILAHSPFEAVAERLHAVAPQADAAFWEAVRGNCVLLPDVERFAAMAYGDIAPVVAAEDAGFVAEAAGSLPAGGLDAASWGQWTEALKIATGRKGKALFRPLRLALTGAETGPEMAALLPLIGRKLVLERLARAAGGG
jgi:glutamyl-tRNA synthetase